MKEITTRVVFSCYVIIFPKSAIFKSAGSRKSRSAVGKQCEPDILPSSRIISSVESRGPEKMVSKFPVLMLLQHNQIEGNHHLSNSKNISM